MALISFDCYFIFFSLYFLVEEEIIGNGMFALTQREIICECLFYDNFHRFSRKCGLRIKKKKTISNFYNKLIK